MKAVILALALALPNGTDVAPNPHSPGVTVEVQEKTSSEPTKTSSTGTSPQQVDPDVMAEGCGVLGFLTDSCGQPPNTPETTLPDEILHAIETIGLPATTLYLQPDTGTTLINIPTIYYTHATV
ncbi:MAG: hypothetical protein QM597_00125, partial [Aeromicrobium sp.]|uniref:hypothetical protein n=1 Tax=Aeromicrobium sp. TaxID=1871063 RepID=UPI0039E5BE20